MSGGARAARREAERARQEEQARQDRIRQGTDTINSTFGQFDDPFFGDIRQSYIDYARPQLDRQFNDAREQLTYALARQGTLNSSTRGEQTADLQERRDLNLQDITDQARQFETDARNNVERARADLLTTLQATGDAEGASNAALSRASILSAPPSYSPLGQLFQDSTALLNQQAALERAFALGQGGQNRQQTGLFGTPTGSVKIGG